MSTDQTTPLPPGAVTPAVGPAPVADFVIANRPQVAIALAVIGLVGLGAAIYCFAKVVNAPKAAETEKDKDKEKEKDILGGETEDKLAVSDPHRSEYIVGGIGGLM